MQQPDPAIGLVIRRARERRHMTQQQLADAVGVSLRTVSNWELGRHVPKNRIGALEEVLGVALDGEPAQAAADLTPTDEWEAGVLADPHLDGDTKRILIERSRDARAAYAAARRERRQAEDRSDPGRKAV